MIHLVIYLEVTKNNILPGLSLQGSYTLSGTGGVKETFQNIAQPLEFRRHIQSQSVDDDDTDPLSQRPT